MVQIVENTEKVYPVYVGNHLARELRTKAKGKSDLLALRAELCRVVGVSNAKLGRWLNNTTQPELGEAVLCAAVLDVTLETLCDTRNA